MACLHINTNKQGHFKCCVRAVSDSRLSNQSYFQYNDKNEVVYCFVVRATWHNMAVAQLCFKLKSDYEIINTTLKLAQPISYGLTLFTLAAFDRMKFDV